MPDHDDEHLHLTALARQGDKFAIATLFEQYRPKLRSMVSFRMDDKLRGRVDPSDVIQESFLDLAKRADEFKSKEMSPLVWMRLVTLERLLAVRRQHIDVQKRDARRERSIDRELGFGATSMALAWPVKNLGLLRFELAQVLFRNQGPSGLHRERCEFLP